MNRYDNPSHFLYTGLHESGKQTGDRVWRMPLYKLYTSHMNKAPLADLNNIGMCVRGDVTLHTFFIGHMYMYLANHSSLFSPRFANFHPFCGRPKQLPYLNWTTWVRNVGDFCPFSPASCMLSKLPHSKPHSFVPVWCCQVCSALTPTSNTTYFSEKVCSIWIIFCIILQVCKNFIGV